MLVNWQELLTIALLVVIGPGGFALALLALLSMARGPEAAWERIGQSRTVWAVLLAVGLVMMPLGLPLALWYFLVLRRRLRRAAEPPAASAPPAAVPTVPVG